MVFPLVLSVYVRMHARRTARVRNPNKCYYTQNTQSEISFYVFLLQ